MSNPPTPSPTPEENPLTEVKVNLYAHIDRWQGIAEREKRRADAAEAERDRYKEALEEIVNAARAPSERFQIAWSCINWRPLPELGTCTGSRKPHKPGNTPDGHFCYGWTPEPSPGTQKEKACTCTPTVLHTDDCAIMQAATVKVTMPNGARFSVYRETLVDLNDD